MYNVEKYLPKSINSILSQTLDFESNCEIIFVDDGSPDNSAEICLEYKTKYPKNIKYIKQKNQGVAAARNKGVRAARGTYISFLDPDDWLSADTLASVYSFFEKHKKEIDVVSIRIDLFEAKEGPHQLNYKYSKSRVINVVQEYDKPQLSGGPSFVKREVFKKNGFDTRLHNASDAKFLAETVLNKMAYGVVKGPVYHYRKRYEDNSIINVSRRRKDWYLDTLVYAHKELIQLSLEKYGTVPKYIQFLLMYDLQFRFKQQEQNVLSSKEEKQYKKLLYDILAYINDDIIIKQRNIFTEHKIFILSKKHGEDVGNRLVCRGNEHFYNGTRVYSYEKVRRFIIEKTSQDSSGIILLGRFRAVILPGVTPSFDYGGMDVVVRRVSRKTMFLGETVTTGSVYSLKLKPVKRPGILTVSLSINKEQVKPVNIQFYDPRVDTKGGSNKARPLYYM